MISGNGWSALFKGTVANAVTGEPVTVWTRRRVVVWIENDGEPIGWILDGDGVPTPAFRLDGFEGFEASDDQPVGIAAAQGWFIREADGGRTPVAAWVIMADGTINAVEVAGDEVSVIESRRYAGGKAWLEPEAGWPEDPPPAQ